VTQFLGREHAAKSASEKQRLDKKLTRSINRSIEDKIAMKSEKDKKGLLQVVSKNKKANPFDIKASKRRIRETKT